MVPWFWLILSLVGGVFVGWFLCALCVVSKDEDQAPERRPRK